MTTVAASPTYLSLPNAEAIVGTANRILDRILAHFDTGERKGGYLCVADQNGRPLLILAFGQVNEEKLPKYLEFCQEKALRLASHPEHISSWQSRNEAESRYGGAVRGKRYIFSFSGLPEKLDEVMTISLAMRCEDLDTAGADDISCISQNQYFLGNRS
jgi:hypothetical protein